MFESALVLIKNIGKIIWNDNAHYSFYFSVSNAKGKLCTGVVGIPHIVPLSVSRTIGTRNTKEHAEGRDDHSDNKFETITIFHCR